MPPFFLGAELTTALTAGFAALTLAAVLMVNFFLPSCAVLTTGLAAFTVTAIITVAGIMAADIIMVIEIVGQCLVNCPKRMGLRGNPIARMYLPDFAKRICLPPGMGYTRWLRNEGCPR